MKILDILTSPWSIKPEKLHEIRGVYETHLRGEKIDWKGMTAQFGLMMSGDHENDMEIENGMAIISIEGVISKRQSLMSWLFGGYATEEIGQSFDAAMENNEVYSILLDIDSPGGTVDGAEELCNKIYNARVQGQKRIIAYSDGEMCSSAYWIGSSADRIFISGETVEAGSIGILGTHIDQSELDKAEGLKWTEIASGPYKRIASGHTSLSKDGAAYLQAKVDYLAGIFTEQALFRNRKMNDKQAAEVSKGATYFGQQAIDAGLVDGVSTKAAIIDLYGNPNSPRTIRAMVEAQVNRTKR